MSKSKAASRSAFRLGSTPKKTKFKIVPFISSKRERTKLMRPLLDKSYDLFLEAAAIGRDDDLVIDSTIAVAVARGLPKDLAAVMKAHFKSSMKVGHAAIKKYQKRR